MWKKKDHMPAYSVYGYVHLPTREANTKVDTARLHNYPKALPSSFIIIDQRFTQGVSSRGVIFSLRTVELSKSYCSSTVYRKQTNENLQPRKA